MQIANARLTAPANLPATTRADGTRASRDAAETPVNLPPALDRFVAPQVSGSTLPSLSLATYTDTPVTNALPVNAVIDLGPGSERTAYSKTSELYSGALTVGLVQQRGPMTSSHTSSRETAVSALDFVDQRGFFGGAASVEVELVPQHTVIERQTMGGQMVEQRRSGVVDENQAVRVRLERGGDGVYRASAGENKAFFVARSEVGYARFVLENIQGSVHGASGVEDTAYGARYGLL